MRGFYYLKFTLALAFVAIACCSMQAATIDSKQALTLASKFLSSSNQSKFMSASSSLMLTHTEFSTAQPQTADYYIFNANDGSAFVIVSGDDRAEEILAYGEGAIDLQNLPINMQAMLDNYKRQMEYLHAHPGLQVSKSMAASSLNVAPLLPSQWSQGTPYNNLCPTSKGKQCVTGCIATSLAQVMYYWKFPNELPDLMGYTTYSLEITMPDLPPVTLDWDEMIDNYSGPYNPSQADAVATLMLYCGQSCYMDYTTTGSGANCMNQWIATQMFGYNPASSVMNRNEYSAEDWHALMQEDLAGNYPILYAGFTQSGSGHSFVIDGFDGSRYHINWGWGGSSDGYFALDAFDPGNSSFSEGQQMIHQLYPEGFGTPVVPYDFEVDGICYKRHGNEVAVANSSVLYNSYSGEITIPDHVTYNGESLTVTAIGNNAFRDCHQLSSVTLPSTIKTIGKYAFSKCTILQSIIIPSSVVKIDYGAFADCYRLNNLVLNNGIQEIGYYAFEYCTYLRSITLPSSLSTISDCSFIGSGLTRINTGEGVTSIGNFAFAFCDRLTTLTIGNNVTSIGTAAFYDCSSLKTVTLGLLVDSIAPMAFNGCYALKSFTAPSEYVPLVEDVECFSDITYSVCTLYVPEEWIEDYMYAGVWELFEHIVGIDTSAIRGDVNGDGEVNIADVNDIIDAILTGNVQTSYDLTGDEEVNIADVNAIIDLILNN